MPKTEFTTLAASNVFTSTLNVQGKQRVNVTIAVGSLSVGTGDAKLSGTFVNLGGSFTGTVTLQRSFNDEVTWHPVNSWAVETEDISDKPEPESVQYKLGVKIGDFTSGEVVVRLGSS